MPNIKSFLLKPGAIAIISLLLIAGAIAAGRSLFNSGNGNGEVIMADTKVQVIVLDDDNVPDAFIEAIGTVKAENQVDVVSVARGTLRSLNFEVGSVVRAGSLLASLYESTVLTGLNNANTNFINTQSNLAAAERLTDEGLRQAELGIQAAAEQVAAAELGVRAAEDNLRNARDLRLKSNADAKKTAIVSYNSFVNTIFGALDQVDALLNIRRANPQASAAAYDPGLGVRSLDAIPAASALFKMTDAKYQELTQARVDSDNITQAMRSVNQGLSLAEQTLSAVINVLDNSVSSQSLTAEFLAGQKNAFIGLRSSVVGAQTSAQTALQNLENLDLLFNTDMEALNNALDSAKNQLDRARTGLENAQSGYQSTLRSKDSQLLAAKSQVDGARGQLNLAQTQAGDLRINAPISGTITKKYAQLGMELSPGTPIAQIANIGTLVVEFSLPIEDANKIKPGQSLEISLAGRGYEGQITRISPTADPITRKVNLEALVTSPDADIIIGSFVDLRIRNLDLGEGGGFYVPLQVLTTTQNEKFVFTVEDGRAAKKPVVTGRTEGRYIEIISGLKPGDALIINGAKLVEDGQKVEADFDNGQL